MTILQAIILGILQGVAEFLPISSSGHLVLFPWLLGWDAPGLTFDTTVHLGTLVAVVIYFWHDIWRIVRGVLVTLRDRNFDDPDGKLGWLLVVGAIPAALAGVLLNDLFESLFSAPLYVAIFLLITGAILFFSEKVAQRTRDLPAIGWKDSILIGIAQAFAIAPGISRSGSTIAAGLALGIKREAAARFSFLLALPVIFGAGMLQLKHALDAGINSSEITLLAAGFIAAAVSGYAAIYYFLAYLRRRNLYPFVWYVWAFGLFALVMALVR